MKFINLTPHDIMIEINGKIKTFPFTGKVARLKQENFLSKIIHNIPIYFPKYGKVIGLPKFSNGIYYIVSDYVAKSLPKRKDLIVPDSGPTAIRENGYVKYVKGFLKFST